MTNDVTPRGFERPHPDNIAREDAGRVRRTIDQIDSQLTNVEAREASEAALGNVRLATAAEASAGTSTTRVPTVKRVWDMIVALVDDVADEVDALTLSVTTALGTKLGKASNLSDLADKAAARNNIGLPIATAAELRAKTASGAVTTDKAWDAAAWVNLGNLTGAVTIDASLGSGFYGVLTDNVTIDVINLKSRQPFEFAPMQDATGGRTVSWSTKFLWPSAAAPEVSVTPNTHAVIVTGVARWDAAAILAAGWKVTA